MTKRRLAGVAAAIGLSAVLWNCGGSSPSSPTPGGTGGGGNGGGGGVTPPAAPVQVVAAGDIGECGFGAQQTGKLLDNLAGTILALGDLAYMNGSAANFRDCYDPFWGRHLARTRPVPGNHEYETDRTASAYFDYFGELAGERGQGYYAFTAGSWRIIALNSEIPATPGSAQATWLRNELTTTRFTCTLAYWHRPLFSSGPNGNQDLPNDAPKNLWRILQEFNADVILAGHDHMYERFERQDVDGKPSATGMRSFVVGTGGAHLYTPGPARPNSAVRASVYGLLVLTLSSESYQWDFASVGNTFRDTNSGVCH